MRTERHREPGTMNRPATASNRAAADFTRRPSGKRLAEIIDRMTDGHRAPGTFRTPDGHTLVRIDFADLNAAPGTDETESRRHHRSEKRHRHAPRSRRNNRSRHARRAQGITFTPNDQPREEV